MKLSYRDVEVIFDVLNVFDPADIEHVYPEMGTQEFADEVDVAWRKLLSVLKNTDTISADYNLRLPIPPSDDNFEIITHGDKKLKEMLNNHKQN